MNEKQNSKLTQNSKELRKNMTDEEKHLWYDFLKHLPMTVNRQKVLYKYIVDFYIATVKLVIELDGSQHYEVDGAKKDKERDQFLAGKGIKVLRYTNMQIKENFMGVCQDILNHIREAQT